MCNICKTIAHHNNKRCRHPWRPSNPGRSHARHSNTRISKAQHTNAPEDHKPCAAQNVLCQYKMHANATPTLLGIVSRVWTGTSRLLVCYPASWSHNVPPPRVVRVALPAGAIVAALARGPEAKAARSAREFRTCDSGYPIVTRPKGLCRLRTFVDLLWVVWAGYGLQRPQGWPRRWT